MIHDAGDTGLYSDSFSHATTLTFSLSLFLPLLFLFSVGCFGLRILLFVTLKPSVVLPGLCYSETVHGNFVFPPLYTFLQECRHQI